jgi:hypothetical protein
MKLKRSMKIFIVILVIILAGGLWITSTPCPIFENAEEAPNYLEDIWPPPQAEMNLGCYVRKSLFNNLRGAGFSVVINTDGIYKLEFSQPSNKDTTPFPDRVSLYMDGEKILPDRYASGGGAWVDSEENDLGLAGWYWLGSSKLLFFGDHTAKVVIATRSGKNLEYEWQFKIK